MAVLDLNGVGPQTTPSSYHTVPYFEVLAAALDDADAMGFGRPDFPADSQIHRFQLPDEDAGKKGGWAIGHDDGGVPVVVIASWKSGEVVKITGADERFRDSANAKPISREQMEAARKRVEEAQAKREEERKAADAAASAKAVADYNAAQPAQAYNAYLAMKGITPEGDVRQEADGTLLVPLWGPSGGIEGVQRIYADGSKKFPSGLSPKGRFGFVGDFTQDLSTVLVTEGRATGGSLHTVINMPVLCAMNCGNVIPACETWLKRTPNTKFVFCADDDRWTKKQDGTPWNPGVEAMQKAVAKFGGTVCIPRFETLDGKPTDFNDLHRREGPDAVKKIVLPAIEMATTRSKDPYGFLDHLEDYGYGSGVYAGDPPPYNWCIEGLIECGNTGVIAGPGALGKSTMACQLVADSAVGKPWMGIWKTGEPGLSLYMSSEDTIEELHRRAAAIARNLTLDERKLFNANAKFIELRGRATLFSQDPKTLNISDSGQWNKFYSSICKLKPKLVIIDPISAITTVDENNNTLMTEVLIRLEELARDARTTIIFLHHTAKSIAMIDSVKELKSNLVQSAIRGASAIVNRPRLAMLGYPLSKEFANSSIVKNEEDKVKFNGEIIAFRDVKKNCGPIGQTRFFRHTPNKGLLEPFFDIKERRADEEDRDIIRTAKQEAELNAVSEALAQKLVEIEQKKGDKRVPKTEIYTALSQGISKNKAPSVAFRAEQLGKIHIVSKITLRNLGFGNKLSGRSGAGEVVIPSFESINRYGKRDENNNFINISQEFIEFIKDLAIERSEDKISYEASKYADEEEQTLDAMLSEQKTEHD